MDRNNIQNLIMIGIKLLLLGICIMMLFKQGMAEEQNAMGSKIKIEDSSSHQIIYILNNTRVAQSLLEQLPLQLEVENYSNNEKIFSPPQKLSGHDAPLTPATVPFTICYFAPWNNIVLFYDKYSPYNGLFELGEIESGQTEVAKLHGQITITAID